MTRIFRFSLVRKYEATLHNNVVFPTPPLLLKNATDFIEKISRIRLWYDVSLYCDKALVSQSMDAQLRAIVPTTSRARLIDDSVSQEPTVRIVDAL